MKINDRKIIGNELHNKFFTIKAQSPLRFIIHVIATQLSLSWNIKRTSRLACLWLIRKKKFFFADGKIIFKV
jgi:hypothetical protein